MSVIVLASAKGAPGVSTATLALAAVWPRRILVAECDPSGGDLAAWWGHTPTPSVLTLAAAVRRHAEPEEVWRHTQTLSDLTGAVEVLFGPPQVDQALALGSVWARLGGLFARLRDADVLVDLGRLVPHVPTSELLQHADRVLLLARPTTAGVTHARSRLAALQQGGRRAGLVLIGEEPHRAADVRDAMFRGQVHPELVQVLADDQRAAAMLAGEPGSPRRLASSLLIRSARALAAALQQPRPGVAAHRVNSLDSPPPGEPSPARAVP